MTKDTLKIHYEILDGKRRKLLETIAPLAKHFILTGGTALALQLKHRQSFDFDFFSDKEIPPVLLGRLKNLMKISTVLINSVDELTVMNEEQVKLSFIYYPFTFSNKLKTLPNGLRMFPVQDIALQKAYTIGRRGTYRDYFDLYTILKKGHLTLREIILNSEKTFGSVFNPKLFLEQLVYFDDLTNFEIVLIEESPIVPEPAVVKTFLEKEVAEFLK